MCDMAAFTQSSILFNPKNFRKRILLLLSTYNQFASQAQASDALVTRVPRAIKSFEEAFQNLELRQQKAQLQTILKAAHIYKDGKIELEFRGENA